MLANEPRVLGAKLAYARELKQNVRFFVRQGFTQDQAFQAALAITELRPMSNLESTHEDSMANRRKARHQSVCDRVLGNRAIPAHV